jgi:hypothetical protein
MMMKRDHKLSDVCFDQMCKFTRALLAGASASEEDNLYPPSAYIMKGIIGTEDWSKYEIHYCNNPLCEGFAWDYVEPSEWTDHADDTCPRCPAGCQSKRFTVDASGSLEPSAYMIYLGLENIIKNRFFTNVTWTSTVGTGRDEGPGGYWVSPEALRMAECLKDFFHTDNGVYELCADWIKPFNSLQYSTGVIGIRCKDQPDGLVSRAFNCEVLAVTPGPREPLNINSVMFRIVQDFKKFGVSTNGMNVVKHTQAADGSITTTQLCHKPFLGAFHADSPGRAKFAYWLGMTAYLMCGWCIYQGTRAAAGFTGKGGKCQYMKGYASPTLQTKPGKFTGKTIKMNRAGLKLTEEEQVERCKAARTTPTSEHSELGARGYSIIRQVLKYVSYNNLWLVPVAHTLLYGLVKSFIGFLLRPIDSNVNIISPENRKLMQKRGHHIFVNTDFGRKYKCVVKYSGSFRMEDWQHFVECFSDYLFVGDVVPANCLAIWRNIQDICRHYCRPLQPSQCTTAARDRMAQKIMEVAKALDSAGFPDCLMTYNLHQLVCRLPVQEQQRGQVAPCLDYWMERLVRRFKEIIQGHVSSNPEKTFTNVTLVEFALSKQLAMYPELISMHRFVRPSQLDRGRPGNNQDGEAYDIADPLHRSQMLGKGKRPPRSQWDELVRLVLLHLKDAKPAGWPRTGQAAEQLVRDALAAKQPRHAWLFQGADVKGEEIIRTAAGFKRGRRQNCWVLVDWTVGGVKKPYICLVNKLLKLEHPLGAAGAEVLRLALCTVHLPMEKAGAAFVARHGHISPDSDIQSRMYPVDLSIIRSKVVGCFPDGYRKGTMYFLQYYNVSKTY